MRDLTQEAHLSHGDLCVGLPQSEAHEVLRHVLYWYRVLSAEPCKIQLQISKVQKLSRFGPKRLQYIWYILL